MIGEARERFTKDLWSERRSDERPLLVTVVDETAQADYVCAEVLAAREAGVPLQGAGGAVPHVAPQRPLEIELTRRNIPFVKFGGLKFLEAAHVKDLLAVLRFAENPRDRVAGFRVLQLLPGDRAGDRRGASWTGSRPRRAPSAGRGRPSRSGPPSIGRPSSQLFELLRAGAAAGRPSSRPRGSGTSRISSGCTRTPRRAPATSLQLGRIAVGFASRTRFLTELTLDPPQATSDLAGAPLRDEDYLILSTIHSAKGQEWRSVFVLNCVDGCIPSDLATGTPAEIEEERRLLYVAMTRAKDALHLITPLRFYTHGQAARGDRHVYAARTRFLPRHVLDRFEEPSWKPKESEAASPQPVPPRDLKARMTSMWS